MALRDEIVGYATLAAMSLLGMLVYSATYAIIYSASSVPTVAPLEMWMVWTHLICACGTCVGQVLLTNIMRADHGIRHLAQAQTALFLGIAASVTALSFGCMNDPSLCAVYFGAAAIPRLAATGAIVWAWFMYGSSLGAQPWDSLTLGLSGTEPLLANAAMAITPWMIARTLVTTCGDAWRLQLCSGVRVTVNAAVTASTITASCGYMDTGLGIGGAAMAVGLVLGWMGEALHPIFGVLAGFVVAIGSLTLGYGGIRPADVRTPFVPSAYYLASAGLGACSVLSSFGAWAMTSSPKKATTTTTAAPEQARTGILTLPLLPRKPWFPARGAGYKRCVD